MNLFALPFMVKTICSYIERVDKVDTLSKKCRHFFEKMQPAARTRCARTLAG